MKSILVPVHLQAVDGAVCDTALAIARLFGSHLSFLGLRPEVMELIGEDPRLAFGQGDGLRQALSSCREHAGARIGRDSGSPDFCAASGIPLADEPHFSPAASASIQETRGEALGRLVFAARHHDLCVMARQPYAERFAFAAVERVLMDSGRPLLLVPPAAPGNVTETVAVWWKETPEAARAVGAAMPLLERARNVLVFTVSERESDDATRGAADLARQLAWHGIRAEAKEAPGDGRAVDRLWTATQRRDAGLVVMGGFGRSRARELIFGGCTQSVLEEGPLPVLMTH